MIRNLRCTVTIDSVLANSKTQNAFLFTVNAIFLHDYPVAVEPGNTPRPLVQKKYLEKFSTYWYAPSCRICLGCCAVAFGNPGGTYIYSVHVCSFLYLSCSSPASYCHLWAVGLCGNFPHYLNNFTIFGKKNLLILKYVFRYSVQLLSKTFLILRRTERNMIKDVHWSTCKVLIIPVRF